jgi:aldose 1-epimerase
MTLQNNTLRLEINPKVGASPAAFEVYKQGWVAVMRPTPRPLPESSSAYSSFTLAPYSNRIRNGSFVFGGKAYALQRAASHAIHGDVRNRPWEVEALADRLVCRYESTNFVDSNWPWAYRLEKTYRLEGSILYTELKLTNLSQEPMPGGFGLHPYFVREAADRLEFTAQGYYPTDNQIIPSGPMKPLPTHLDFSSPGVPESLDTVFGGWGGQVTLHRAGFGLVLSADPVFGHLIVYTAPDGTIALEPVTHATNALNASDKQQLGVQMLAPGSSLQGSVRIEVRFSAE